MSRPSAGAADPDAIAEFYHSMRPSTCCRFASTLLFAFVCSPGVSEGSRSSLRCRSQASGAVGGDPLSAASCERADLRKSSGVPWSFFLVCFCFSYGAFGLNFAVETRKTLIWGPLWIPIWFQNGSQEGSRRGIRVKLVRSAFLEPFGDRSWSRLGPLVGPSWVPDGPVLGPLERPGGSVEPSWTLV